MAPGIARGSRPLPFPEAGLPHRAAPAGPAADADPVPPMYRVDDRDGLEAALRELAKIDDQEHAAATEHRLHVEALTRQFQQRLVIQRDGKEVSIADWRNEVRRAAQLFCSVHKVDLLPKDAKSVQLMHGRVGWKKQPDTLQPVNVERPKGNQALLDKILAKLVEAVGALTFFKKSRVIDCYKFLPSVDKAAVLKFLKSKQLSVAEVKNIGFVLQEGSDDFFIEPKAAQLESQTSVPSQAPPA